MNTVIKKDLLTLMCGAGLALSTAATASAASFLDEVPADDWSYGAVNNLIETGNVTDYSISIPEGRVLSRMEMAAIVDAAYKNKDAFSEADQFVIEQLNKDYYYDIKKVNMLNNIDNIDMASLDAKKGDVAFSEEEKAKIKKAADFADRFNINGSVRIRNDHYLRDIGPGNQSTGKTERATRSNHLQVFVHSDYKINDNWKANTDLTYRRSMNNPSFLFNKGGIDVGETEGGINPDIYLTGNFMDDCLKVKIGRWYEWDPFGWGMDIDGDYAGLKFEFGKKLKTYLTIGQMDEYDYVMYNGKQNEDGTWDTGTTGYQNVNSLRFFYPFDNKNDVNFGISVSDGMRGRGQVEDRVLYYFAHGHHKFDDNWDLRAGIINSNAQRLEGVNRTKKPGQWLQLQYKNADVNKPGSYAITADYRYEPSLTWPTVTDWCGNNEKFFRLGFAYVPAKNILLDTFYTWAREIDTNARDDMFRFQAHFFF